MTVNIFCILALFVTHASLLVHAVRVADDLAAVINGLGLAILFYLTFTATF